MSTTIAPILHASHPAATTTLAPISSFQHAFSGQVLCAAGAVQRLFEISYLKKAKKILIVSDVGVKQAGILEKVTASLVDRELWIDTDTTADGNAAHVEKLAGLARDEKIEVLIAVGGGSCMDTAKTAAALANKGGSLAEMEGFAKVRCKSLPVICIPTTAGTGAEATQFAVIFDHVTQKKRILVDQSLIPAAAILDPQLSLSLPTHLTAATGVDALTHALEALAAKTANPVGDIWALEALQRVATALPQVLVAPGDIQARTQMMWGAYCAGMAISTSMLGACHAFAHVLGAEARVHHGVANGIFLVPVLRFNAEHGGKRAHSAYSRAAHALGLVDTAALITQIEALVHEVAQIPTTVKTWMPDATEDHIQRLATLTLEDPDVMTNPAKLSHEQAAQIWRTRVA